MIRFLLSLLFCTTAYAVEVDGIAKEHKPIRVQHGEGVTVNVMFWQGGEPKMLPEDHFVRYPEETVFSAPAGTYAVVQGKSSIVVIAGEGSPIPTPGPIPDPTPGPDPEPDPPAPPVSYEGAWVLIIEESAERDADFTKVIQDRAYWDSLKARTLRWAILDDDTPHGSKYRNTVADVGVPALVIITKDAKVLDVRKLPDSTDEIDRIVREKTGK